LGSADKIIQPDRKTVMIEFVCSKSASRYTYMLSKIPSGQFPNLQEAAAIILWLCPTENSFTTAGVFDLSGGRAIY
jgi:hypothetical protein